MQISQNFIGRLFGSTRHIRLSDTGITVVRKRQGSTRISYSELSDLPTTQRLLFGTRLNVPVGANLLCVSMLHAQDAENIVHHLEQHAAKQFSTAISAAVRLLRSKAHYEYFRDSSSEAVEIALSLILKRYSLSKERWQELLDEYNIEALGVFAKVMPLEAGKQRLREHFERRTIENREEFLDNIESNPLTLQQRQAVVRNNDLNLVLAAAGTGKTSVMVAKAIHLIDTERATGEEILVLAYNNSAAKELKVRVDLRGEPHGIDNTNSPNISTFHALGRKVLKTSGIPVRFSDMADDPIKLAMWVTDWLCRYIRSSSDALRKFILLSYQPVNPFDFKTRAEYEEYVRDNEYRTLQGELVKGYQEWLIANWLFEQGVKYTYEPTYVTKRRVDIGFDYRPDFHFIGTEIYLEHFGIDRNGKTRPDIDRDKYNASMSNKRELHAEQGTTLVETYHYDWMEGNLETRLAHLVDAHNIVTNPRSLEDLFRVLKDQGFVDEGAERYMKCVKAMRAESLDRTSAYHRLVKEKVVFAAEYAELLGDLQDDYVAELEAQLCIDFDDMIIRATNVIESGQYRPSWKHILVDEFQDISMARMTFLRSLISHGPNPTLTAVGDDWQSIYRFAGGKLELTTRFQSLVGNNTMTKLEKTFRYNSSIASTAGTFVMQNPEQYRKDVIAHEEVKTSHVNLLDCTNKDGERLEDRTLEIVKTIREQDAEGSIAIIARYNYLLKSAQDSLKTVVGIENMRYWTFHRSKGLEADYCILIGLFRGKSGFPNSNKDEAVIEALLPSLDAFPNSEERRLMYVGLTRARKRSYLIADAMAPSVFIEELLTPRYELQIESEMFEERHRKIFRCRMCDGGYYKKYTGEYGDFYRCSSGPSCVAKPRICEKCGSPSIDDRQHSVCNNEACRLAKAICEKCGRPMKEREGPHGRFLGCSGFGIPDDQCKNTRRLV